MYILMGPLIRGATMYDGDAVDDSESVGVIEGVIDMVPVTLGVTEIEPVFDADSLIEALTLGVLLGDAPVDNDAVAENVGENVGVTERVRVAVGVTVRVSLGVTEGVRVDVELRENVGEADDVGVVDRVPDVLGDGVVLTVGVRVRVGVSDGVDVTELAGEGERDGVPVTLGVGEVEKVGVAVPVIDIDAVDVKEGLDVKLGVTEPDTLMDDVALLELLRLVDTLAVLLRLLVTDPVTDGVGLRVGVTDGVTDGVGDTDADFVSTYSTYTDDNTLPSNSSSPGADTTCSITKRTLPKYSLLLGAVTVITPTSLQFDVVKATLSSTVNAGQPYPLSLSFIMLVNTDNATNGADVKLTLYDADCPSNTRKYRGSSDTPLSGNRQSADTQSPQPNT
jgi:hypothetical protein